MQNRWARKRNLFFSSNIGGDPHLLLIENFTFSWFPAFREGDTGERFKREELRKEADYMLRAKLAKPVVPAYVSCIVLSKRRDPNATRLRTAWGVESSWSKIIEFLAFHMCQSSSRKKSMRIASGKVTPMPMSPGRWTRLPCKEMPRHSQTSCALWQPAKMWASVSKIPE